MQDIIKKSQWKNNLKKCTHNFEHKILINYTKAQVKLILKY